MTYSPSPRPTFNGPAAIPYATVTRHLWGDGESGEVADWIYVSSGEIHQLVFGLPPGGAFRHSDSFRTIFGADEVLYVLSGSMVLANPETGEVQRIEAGEAAFFRRDTWHHCFSYGSQPLRVLEIFAPPPAKGTSGAYAQTKPNLTQASYVQDQWLGQWPMQQAQARAAATIRPVRAADILWRLEDGTPPLLTGILASTEHLTVGFLELRPGQKSHIQQHAGDECLYVLEGTLNVRLPESNGQTWHELAPKDGFYVPAGVGHQYYNISDEIVKLLFGVAPCYLADAGPGPSSNA
jgi:quercetin dioxygenase-like cupin family protein